MGCTSYRLEMEGCVCVNNGDGCTFFGHSFFSPSLLAHTDGNLPVSWRESGMRASPLTERVTAGSLHCCVVLVCFTLRCNSSVIRSCNCWLLYLIKSCRSTFNQAVSANSRYSRCFEGFYPPCLHRNGVRNDFGSVQHHVAHPPLVAWVRER